MKFIIIGLGNFGASLAVKLTAMGHDVIGADSDIQKLELFKNSITHVVSLDCTDAQAISTLPLKEANVVVVAIGENFGASVMATALLKQMKVNKLISRSMSSLHETVIEAIGVDEIVSPEEESAERLAKRLESANVVDSFELSEDYSIVEITVPKRYIGVTLEEADFRGRYKLNIVTVKKLAEVKNIFGSTKIKPNVMGVISPLYKFEKGDILVVFGKEEDVEKFLETEKD